MADLDSQVEKAPERQAAEALVRGMQERARQGKQISGFTLLGYAREYDSPERPGQRSAGRLAVQEAEARVVRLIYRKYLELGSARAAATWLNENGHWKPVKSEKNRLRFGLGESRPFDRGDVLRTIKNPLYAGWATWGKQRNSRRLQGFEMQRVYRPELQIVSQDLWDRANAQRERNSRTPPRAVTSAYAFSLLLVCKSCGGALTGATTGRGREKRYKRYRCSRLDRAGRTACEAGQTIHESVVARALLPRAAELVQQGLNQGTVIEGLARDLARTPDRGFERAWRAELTRTRREIRNLVRAIARGVIADEQAKSVLHELSEKRSRLEDDLANLSETAQLRRELMEALGEADEDPETGLWLLLAERPAVLNQVLRLVFEERSVVVRSWGAGRRRESEVVRFKLTEAFSRATVLSAARGAPR